MRTIFEPADCNASIAGEIAWRFAEPILADLISDGSNVWIVQVQTYRDADAIKLNTVSGRLTAFMPHEPGRSATVTITPDEGGAPVTIAVDEQLYSLVVP